MTDQTMKNFNGTQIANSILMAQGIKNNNSIDFRINGKEVSVDDITMSVCVETETTNSGTIPQDLLVETKKVLSKTAQENMSHLLISKKLESGGWKYTNPKGFSFVLSGIFSTFIVKNGKYQAYDLDDRDTLPRKSFWVGVCAN